MLLAFAVPCMEQSQAGSCGSHGEIKGGLSSSYRVFEREQPLYCHWPVRTMVCCLLLALCGQLVLLINALYYTCYQAICHALY